MLLAALLLLAQEPSAGSGPPLPEGNAYVQSLVGRQRAREEDLNRYSYDVLETQEQLASDGRVTQRETKAFEVFFVKGAPVRRQVAENGRPLAQEKQQQEDRKVEKKVRAIQEGRVAREQAGPRLSRVLERYDFRTLERQTLEARATLHLEFRALPGKRDLDSDNVLRALAGRIWVDEEDRAVARAEIHNTAGIKFALGLGASVKTVDVRMEFQRMSDGVWLPRLVSATAAGRMLIFKSFRRRNTTSYSNFRRFEAEPGPEQFRPEPPPTDAPVPR